MSKKTYWAAEAPEKFAKEFFARKKSYYADLKSTGRLDLARRLHNQCYAGFYTGAQINQEGEQGEYSDLEINHFGSLLERKIVMTVGQRLNMEARAATTDVKSQNKTIFSNGYLENCQEEKGLEEATDAAVEGAMLHGEHATMPGWNERAGKELGVDEATGNVVYAGDIEFTRFGPLGLIRDTQKSAGVKHNWFGGQSWGDKYALAGAFPALADAILDIEAPDPADDECPRLVQNKLEMTTDDIPVYTALVEKHPGLPSGRFMLLLSPDVVLLDGPLPYRRMNIERLIAKEEEDSPWGYSVSFDMLAIQEAISGLASIILTNQATFGIQNVWSKLASGLKISQLLGGGLNHWESPEKPEPLNLTQTPPEVSKFLDWLVGAMETLSGVNSVSRGNPQSSDQSGQALALLAAQAIEFNAKFQRNYARYIRGLGRQILHIGQDFIKYPYAIKIAGKSNQTQAKEFTGKDIEGVDDVYVDLGNPMMRTAAGRKSVADQLLAAVRPDGKPMIENPQQYMAVIATGKLENMTEAQTNELLYIRAENEAMLAGKVVPVRSTDNDALHLIEHRAPMQSVDARNDPSLTAIFDEHDFAHYQQLLTKDPILAQVLGQFAAPPMMPPAPGGPPGGPPPGPGAPTSEPVPAEAEGMPSPAEPPPLPLAS